MSYYLVAPNGTKVPLPAQPLRFGSDASADVRLSSKLGLAPLHFLLQPNGLGFTLETLTPGFPVYVNDEQAASQDLKDGDSIRAGSFCVKYEGEPGLNYLVPPPERRPMAFGSLPSLPPNPAPAVPVPEETDPPPVGEASEGLNVPPPPELQSKGPQARTSIFSPEPTRPLSPVPPMAQAFGHPTLPEPATAPESGASGSVWTWAQRAQQGAPVPEPKEFRLFNSPPPGAMVEPMTAPPLASQPQLRGAGLVANRDALPVPALEKPKGRWSTRSMSPRLALLGAGIAALFTLLMWGALEGCRAAWGDFTMVALLKVFCYLTGAAGIGWAAASIVVVVDRVRHPKQPVFVAAAVLSAGGLATLLLALPLAAPSTDGVAKLVDQIKNAKAIATPGLDWASVADRAGEPWALLGIAIAAMAAYLRSHRESG